MEQEYICPVESTVAPLCKDCPFRTQEGGKYFCHAASSNFLYPASVGEVVPIIFPAQIGRAEIRYIEQDGRKILQILEGDLKAIPESAQEPKSKLKFALDSKSLPSFRRNRKGGGK